ncbi:hypothetical protein BK129_03110 [Paenibacillus amylolyticus]|uniref:hypothetical protein n=1 Tax=Paenibacillus amylolyticus TaxID=1451 RepID=UPI00096F421B|nr:hypothetical protein [Paenibacillus amylolyticus]OMF09841.1 hypothetical protein BK129_03110 [Paenibacillus amylolyticus]
MAIQEIALDIDLSIGVFKDTIYQAQKLKLRELSQDADGNSIYPANGSWESTPIRIQDKIASFKGVAASVDVVGGASYKIYWSTSEDVFEWGAYEEILADVTATKAPAKYMKVKIEIFAEKKYSNFYIDDFKENGKYNNSFVESDSGSLGLKKIYQLSMERASDTSTGRVLSQKVENTKFKKLDRIRVSKG